MGSAFRLASKKKAMIGLRIDVLLCGVACIGSSLFATLYAFCASRCAVQACCSWRDEEQEMRMK
jgi:hypothetical protein